MSHPDETSPVSDRVEADATLPPGPLPTGAADVRAPAGYEIERELGRGGMGVVYLARHRGLGRVCALKMMLAGALADAEDRQRFRTEAQSVARLAHPNIVQVFEVGTHLGQPFMALEFCPGGGLDAKLAAGPLPPRDAAALVRCLAEAMRAVHAANILHRDLKPANVLLTETGTPKVTDFGLARRLDEAGLTATGKVVGTLKYMSPEQAHGRRDLAPASDVYALGAILYECLTGRPPFQAATTMDTLMQVLFAEPVPVRQLSREVARDLETICHRCLHKDPRRRYADAGGLADDLGRFLAGEPVVARPVGALERAAKWVRRNAVVSALASVILVVLTAGLVTAAVLAGWAYHERDQAQAAERDARTEKGRADGELRRAEWLLYAGQLSLAQSAFTDGDGHLGLRHLAGCQWNLRRWEHRHLWTRYNSRQVFAGHAGDVHGVCVSPDGQRLATASGDGQLKIWDPSTAAEVLTLQGHRAGVVSLAYSPDGKRLVAGYGDGTAKLWDAASGKDALTLRADGHEVAGVAFSPDGKRLVTGAGLAVRVWDAATGEPLRTFPFPTGMARGVAVSPDGKRIVAGGSGETALVWDAETGRVIAPLEGLARGVSGVAYSPDGGSFVTGSWDGTATVWDGTTGRVVHTLAGHRDRVNAVAVSPDGRRVATGSDDRTAKVWDAKTGKELLTLRGNLDRVNAVCFSPDGRRIFTGGRDRTARAWDADQGQEVLTLRGHPGMTDAGFSPDGGRVVTCGMDRTTRVWDAATGRALVILEGHRRVVVNARFSPDGRYLLTGSLDNSVRVWGCRTWEEAFALSGEDIPVEMSWVDFAPDSRRFATAGGGMTTVWDVEKRAVVCNLPREKDEHGVNGVAFSPDGRRLVTANVNGTVRVSDAATGAEIATFRGHAKPVVAACFSPDGERIGTASDDRTATVWDVATGRELLTLKGHTDRLTGVCFSPDGARVVTASADWTAKVWDAATGQELLTLKGHNAAVTAVRFSRDGRRLVTASQDGTAMVWEARTAQAAFALEGPNAPVASVAFTPDGRRIFAWDEGGGTWAWNAAKGTPVEPVEPPTRPGPGPALAPDGTLRATANDTTVEVTDRRLADPKANHWPPPDRDERRRYHAERAAEAEKAKQWYAVAFHVGRLLLDDPDNADLKKRRDDAMRKHDSPAPKTP